MFIVSVTIFLVRIISFEYRNDKDSVNEIPKIWLL